MEKNKKGFILIELLIVAVFTASLFTFLYVNVLPIIGDYEQKEKYDTIDTKYVLYDLRKEILTYGSNTNELWDLITEQIKEQGFARLYEYNGDKIRPNATLYQENGTELQQLQFTNWKILLEAYHIKSIYITRYGLGNYPSGTQLPYNYQNLRQKLKNSKLLVNECQGKCNKGKENYAQITEEYIKKMKSFTLGYEYKKEYYRMIACQYPLDLQDTYCGTIEIMRK